MGHRGDSLTEIVDFSARPRHKGGMRRASIPSAILVGLALASCGDPVPYRESANNAAAAEEAPNVLTPGTRPVRVGEFGPAFAACAAAGTTRRLEQAQDLAVRAAPFDNGAAVGTIPSGARFFICSRSLDQKWFGVIYDEGGTLAQRCGVSDPVNGAAAYSGPCKSGWVEGAYVKFIAGNDLPDGAAQGNSAAAAPSG
jgi:hypothetical protein